MKKPQASLAAASLAALLALGACSNEPVTAPVNDPQAEALKSAPPVTPPPAIQASRTFRCKDNSLIYAEYYTNNTAKVRTEKDGAPTVLTAENGAPPYKAEGWSLSDNAAQVTLTAPGKGTQSCKA